MVVKLCPHCNVRYIVGPNITDYEHECSSGNDAIDQEDVVVTGTWEDFSGSGTRGAYEVVLQGIQNELQGTTAGIQGGEKEKLTRRGKIASTHRQRQHFEFINIKNEGLQ